MKKSNVVSFEKKETIMDTININKKANPGITKASILQPYEAMINKKQ